MFHSNEKSRGPFFRTCENVNGEEQEQVCGPVRKRKSIQRRVERTNLFTSPGVAAPISRSGGNNACLDIRELTRRSDQSTAILWLCLR